MIKIVIVICMILWETMVIMSITLLHNILRIYDTIFFLTTALAAVCGCRYRILPHLLGSRHFGK